jgi:hypothetical protein
MLGELVSLVVLVGDVAVKDTASVGLAVRTREGFVDEINDGEIVGLAVGTREGFADGLDDGAIVGSLLEGCCVGSIDGSIV